MIELIQFKSSKYNKYSIGNQNTALSRFGDQQHIQKLAFRISQQSK